MRFMQTESVEYDLLSSETHQRVETRCMCCEEHCLALSDVQGIEGREH